MPNIKSIFHINVNVTNFERSLKFYEMLGFHVVKCWNALSGRNGRRSGATYRGDGIVDIDWEIEKPSSREFFRRMPLAGLRLCSLGRSRKH